MSPERLLFLTDSNVKETNMVLDSIYITIESETLTFICVSRNKVVIYLGRDVRLVISINDPDLPIDNLPYFKLAIEMVESLYPDYDMTWFRERIALVDQL